MRRTLLILLCQLPSARSVADQRPGAICQVRQSRKVPRSEHQARGGEGGNLGGGSTVHDLLF